MIVIVITIMLQHKIFHFILFYFILFLFYLIRYCLRSYFYVITYQIKIKMIVRRHEIQICNEVIVILFIVYLTVTDFLTT